MTAPKHVHLPAFEVVGLPLRTSNADEMNPETARIKKHWEQFWSEGYHERIPKASDKLLGVYTNYESDHTGPYTLVPGFEVTNLDEVSADLVRVQIPEQNYLVFHKKGEMPGIVFAGWGEVIAHFQDEEIYERAYDSDFELYPNETEVEIHISVRKKKQENE